MVLSAEIRHCLDRVEFNPSNLDIMFECCKLILKHDAEFFILDLLRKVADYSVYYSKLAIVDQRRELIIFIRDNAALLIKIFRVINSCKTRQHRTAARCYVRNAKLPLIIYDFITEFYL